MTDPHHCRDNAELTEAGDVHSLGACSVLAESFRTLRGEWFQESSLAASQHPEVRKQFDQQTEAIIAGKQCVVAPRHASEVLQ